MKTSDTKLVEEAITILKRSGSLTFAQEKMRELITEAWNDLDPNLPVSSAKLKLKALVDYLIERDI